MRIDFGDVFCPDKLPALPLNVPVLFPHCLLFPCTRARAPALRAGMAYYIARKRHSVYLDRVPSHFPL